MIRDIAAYAFWFGTLAAAGFGLWQLNRYAAKLPDITDEF
jgi:hypothetical protein